MPKELGGPHCAECLRTLIEPADIKTGQRVAVKNRWGVKGMHVVLGEKTDERLLPDALGHNLAVHTVLEVIGASAPKQDSRLLDSDAESYLEEFMEEGIKFCKIKPYDY